MINVQPNDILDVILNIPNVLCTLYFQSKACKVKYKKTYIAVFFLVISALTFFQNVGLMSREIHVVVACVVVVLDVQLFITDNRFAALQFCVFLYFALVLCEAVSYVVCFAIFGESILVMIEETRNMIYIKLYFAIASFIVEYAVYRLWIGKADRVAKNFNKNIFIALPLELLLAWCTLWISLAEPRNSNAAVVLLCSLVFTLTFNILQFAISEQNIRKKNEFAKTNILKEQIESQKNRKNALAKQIDKADETKAYILENIDKATKFLEKKHGEDAHEQLQDIVDTISVKYLYSNNKIADALLADKTKVCDKYGIRLECHLVFPKDMRIDNARLCIVLSNLLDNAIRACFKFKEKYGEDKNPFISIKVIEQFGYLVIRQENSFTGVVENRRSGAFSEHGLGLEIVKNIAEELGGELVTEHDDKMFVTSFGIAR